MYVPLDTDLDIILVLGAMYVAMLLTDFYEYILRIFRSCADNFYVVLRNFIRAGSSSEGLRLTVTTSTSGAPKQRCG